MMLFHFGMLKKEFVDTHTFRNSISYVEATLMKAEMTYPPESFNYVLLKG